MQLLQPISSRLSESVTKETHNLTLNILLFELSPINPIALRTAMGWSGGAMVLGKLLVPGVLLICIIIGQGPSAFAEGAGVGCFFTHLSFLSSFSLSLGDGLI